MAGVVREPLTRRQGRGLWRVCALAVTVGVGILAAGAVPQAGAADIIIIANAQTPDQALTPDAVRAIFLGDRTRWSNESKIVLVTLKDGDAHQEFLRDNVGKTPSQFLTYWKNIMFTGKGKLPQSFASEDELLKYVASTEGAIGYLSARPSEASVKIIEIAK